MKRQGVKMKKVYSSKSADSIPVYKDPLGHFGSQYVGSKGGWKALYRKQGITVSDSDFGSAFQLIDTDRLAVKSSTIAASTAPAGSYEVSESELYAAGYDEIPSAEEYDSSLEHIAWMESERLGIFEKVRDLDTGAMKYVQVAGRGQVYEV